MNMGRVSTTDLICTDKGNVLGQVFNTSFHYAKMLIYVLSYQQTIFPCDISVHFFCIHIIT